MTGAAFYDAADARQPLDPEALRQTVRACLFCGDDVVVVGIFCPTENAEAQGAVLRLRRHALAEGRDAGLAYGLCATHSQDADDAVAAVEARIYALADRVALV